MATEKQANKARDEHAELLYSLGVHSIGVDEIGKKGSKNFAVVAFIDKMVKSLPKELTVHAGSKKVNVPLLTQVKEKFKPEKL